MKKISILLSAICVAALVGCSDKSSPNTPSPEPSVSAAESSSAPSEPDEPPAPAPPSPAPAEAQASEASQEKVTDLTFALPSAVTETPATINAGDIYIWSDNNLVLFYTTFSNSYSYVPVGYIEDVTGLRDALGRGSAEVTFSTND